MPADGSRRPPTPPHSPPPAKINVVSARLMLLSVPSPGDWTKPPAAPPPPPPPSTEPPPAPPPHEPADRGFDTASEGNRGVLGRRNGSSRAANQRSAQEAPCSYWDKEGGLELTRRLCRERVMGCGTGRDQSLRLLTAPVFVDSRNQRPSSRTELRSRSRPRTPG